MKTILAHIRSRRSILLLAASVAGIAAIFAEKPWSVVLGVIAVAGYGALILILSIRISQLVRRIGILGRSVSKAAPATTHAAGRSMEEVRVANRMTSAIDTLDAATNRLSSETPMRHPHPERRGVPRVTVVVPCYNEERFVAETLRSVAEQTYADWECVIVDDASTDKSLHHIWAATKSDERFRVLRHQVNSGLSAARNTGLRAARGDFVTFLDADDLLMRDSLMDRVIALANAMDDPHVIGSYCGVTVAFEETHLEELPDRMDGDSRRIIDLVSADAECPFNAHAPLLITQRLRALGGFNERMRYGAEDWNLWYRTMRNGYVFVPSQYKTAVYRQKRHSMVRSMPDGHVLEANRLIESAYRPADPDLLIAPSPTPLTRPIGDYQAQIHRAKRAIRFAAMALVAGDEPAARRALVVFEEAPLPLIERHVDIADMTNRGMQRALAVSHRELTAMKSLSDPIRQRLQTLIREVSKRYEPEPVALVPKPSIGALVVPHHAGQFQAMFKAAMDAGFSESEIGVLIVEREGGRQGATVGIPESFPRWSLNEWVLQDVACAVVVVGRIRIGVVDQIAAAVAETGGLVIEVDQPDVALMQLAEAHRGPLPPLQAPALARPGLRLIALNTDAINPGEIEPSSSWQMEEYPETTFDARDMAAFKDRHRGERVVIIGNGPSLNELDLTRLKTEYTIAVNGIFYAADSMGFDPSFYVVEDTAVMRDNLGEIVAYHAGHKFFPSIYRDMVGDLPEVTYFMMNRGFYEPRSPNFCVPRFSVDPAQRIYSGQSVTHVNLQLAYHLGFEEVVLVGMDFSYTVPSDAIVEGDLITSASADPNHFHPDYFGAGKVWKDPKLDRVLANYALAKQLFETDGRRILNATAGGKLEIFERVDYARHFQ